MKYGNLIIEKKEYVYLKRILNISGYAEDFETQKSLTRLSEELKYAQIVSEEEIPRDVIRFNSRITVASENKWEKTIQLVAPPDRDAKLDKISILTPMGAALFGYAQGDTMEWEFPSGNKQLSIVKVGQDISRNKIETPI